jgi:hypothetical protein
MYNDQDKTYFILNISRFSHFDTKEDCKEKENENKSTDEKLHCINDDEYNELFYYDILEVHYSNLFINFKDDMTLMNYINTIKSNSNNYLIINLLKANKFISNIYNHFITNKRKELIKKHLCINKKNLYEKHIIKYIEWSVDRHTCRVEKLSCIFTYKNNFSIKIFVQDIKDNIILKFYIDLLYLKDDIDIKHFNEVGIIANTTKDTNDIKQKINDYNNKKISHQTGGNSLSKTTNNINIELENYDENNDNKIVNKFIKIIIDTNKEPVNIKSSDTIIITKDDIDSLNCNDLYKYIRLVMVYYNTRIIELFYTQPKITKICILLLLKRVYPDLTKKYKMVINTTLSLIYYQFIAGGLLRDNQIDIIYTILTNYSFNNNYTDIIKNTYTSNYKNTGDLFNTPDSKCESSREIHDLIMGAGKTKMITPIILIFLYECIAKSNTDKNILLILPSKLINQSYMFLKYSIEYFLNYNVSICYDLFDKSSNSKIKIISDINIKSSLITTNISTFDKDKYYVLLDEADMILNPLTSEMIYPDNKKYYLEKDNFNKLINILFDVLKYNNRSLKKSYAFSMNVYY